MIEKAKAQRRCNLLIVFFLASCHFHLSLLKNMMFSQIMTMLSTVSIEDFGHLEEDNAAAASIGTPLQWSNIMMDMVELFCHLVNVDALGVNVLGPRLAVEGHLHTLLSKMIRKKCLQFLVILKELEACLCFTPACFLAWRQLLRGQGSASWEFTIYNLSWFHLQFLGLVLYFCFKMFFQDSACEYISMPAIVLLGFAVASPWESLLGEACLVLLHPCQLSAC